MKTYYLALVALCILIVSACKSHVNLTVSEPAAVYLEKNYETAGVINRSFASGGSKVLETLDNALTLEGNLDYEGSQAATKGIFDELTVNPQFKRVVLLDSMTVKNGGIDVFPAPLEWSEVERICEENQVQLLFVLEVYDTDTKIDYSTQTVQQRTPLGNVPLLQHTAVMTCNIKTGWRIYDPANKWIRDQFWLRDRIQSRGSGINPVKAASTLMNRGQIVRQLSTQMGRFYAGRVVNQLFRVWRDYFNKGSRNLTIAKRRAQVGDWEGAAELWKKDTESSKRKVAGRACFNMAVYSEIIGDLNGALAWAQKAYTDYNNNAAQDYANVLRRRVQRWEENTRRKDADE